MKSDNEYNDVRHLISRAGFGFSPKAYQIAQNKNRNVVIRQIFKEAKEFQPLTLVSPPEVEPPSRYQMTMDPAERKKQNQEKFKMMREQIEQMNDLWFKRMQGNIFGLREKMTLFWHGHFACRSNNSYFVQQYYNTLHNNALGNFGDLLVAVSKTPAMLEFLNNQQNRKAHPNENFAREVMELFTLGRGYYTENDIKESARAFTGWGFNNKGEFVFREKQHDDDSKTFLTRTGNFTGDDVLAIILKQPETSLFITKKIYRYFVNETPDDDLVGELASGFRKSNYDIAKLLHTIFTSDWFYKEKNKGVLIKSPIELLSNIMRVNEVDVGKETVLIQFQRILGQMLFNPPNVAGWKGGKSWIDSSSLLMRMRLPEIFYYDKEFLIQPKITGGDLDSDFYAAEMAQERINENYLKQAHQRVGAVMNWEPYLAIFEQVPQERLFDVISALHLDTNKLSVSKEAVESSVDKSTKANYIKGVTTLLMSTPEYQMS